MSPGPSGDPTAAWDLLDRPTPTRSPALRSPALRSPALRFLAARWRDARNRLLASRRFQRWAAGFPLTRPIARRRTRALFDLCAGFVYSQVLLACVQLDLFKILGEGSQTTARLSARLSLSHEATERLLRAAAALGLAARDGPERYGLGPHGAVLAANPGIAAMVEHHRLFYADLRDPVALLRGAAGETALSRYWPYAAPDAGGDLRAEGVAPYSALMSASQPMIADEIFDAYSFKGHARLLDVGGGDGTFVAAAAAKAPWLRLTLFDLPPVAALAKTRLQQAGLAARVAVASGDVFADPLPADADIACLIRVVHDHDDRAALAILRAVRRALPQDGTLLLAEPMSGAPGAQTATDAYFGFYLLAMGRGRPRSARELAALLRDAGFSRVRRAPTRTPLLTGVIVARP